MASPGAWQGCPMLNRDSWYCPVVNRSAWWCPAPGVAWCPVGMPDAWRCPVPGRDAWGPTGMSCICNCSPVGTASSAFRCTAVPSANCPVPSVHQYPPVPASAQICPRPTFLKFYSWNDGSILLAFNKIFHIFTSKVQFHGQGFPVSVSATIILNQKVFCHKAENLKKYKLGNSFIILGLQRSQKVQHHSTRILKQMNQKRDLASLGFVSDNLKK